MPKKVSIKSVAIQYELYFCSQKLRIYDAKFSQFIVFILEKVRMGEKFATVGFSHNSQEQMCYGGRARYLRP